MLPPLRAILRRLLPALLLVCVGFLPPVTTPSLAQPIPPVPQVEVNFADLAERLRPAVVNIRVIQQPAGGAKQFFFNGQPLNPNDPQMPDIFRHFLEQFGVPQQPERQGLGSGLILSDDGYIATNHHVVAGAKKIAVVLSDETEYEGTVIGSDPKTDLALVKIDPKSKLAAAKFGNSDTLRVGEWVMAVGNPFGLAETVTVGIVSAKSRVIGAGPYDDFIQTDASINPGNSGGPLFNTHGEVVGINTAITAQGQGIGFAIPSNLARSVIDQLRDSGVVVRGWLGVGIQPITSELAESMGFQVTAGALVSQVFDNTPAQKAGFMPEDVIIEYDGAPITHSSDLPRMVAHTKPGSTVSVRIVRKGKNKRLLAVIDAMPQEPGLTTKTEDSPSDKHALLDRYGLSLQTLTPDLAEQLGIKAARGAVISEIRRNSPAEHAGLARADIIVQANRAPIGSVDDFIQIAKRTGEERLLLRVARGQNYLFAVLKP